MAEETKPAEPVKKSKLKLFIIIGVVLVVLAGGGTAALLMFGGGGKKAEAAEGKEDEGGHGGEKGEGKAGESLVSFDTFVVNLADPKGDRFLKATIRAVLSDPEVATELQKDELTRTRVRDRIISVLTSKSFEEVASPGGKDALRQQLLREINQSLPDDVVSEVLFVEFVVQ